MKLSLSEFLNQCYDMESDEAIDYMVENYDLCLKEGEKLYSIWRKNYVDIAGRVATLKPAQQSTSYNNVFIKYIRKLKTMQG